MDKTDHTPLCPKCDQAMKFIRAIPRLGSIPELHVFYCAKCIEAATIEAIDRVHEIARKPDAVSMDDQRAPA
jgi:hypothetical protein